MQVIDTQGMPRIEFVVANGNCFELNATSLH